MRPRKTILCVDAHEQALSLRKFLLDTCGYRVIGFTTPHDALAYLERAMPGAVDLLVADLLLDGMDGNELARRAKRIHPRLPVLLTSQIVASCDRALNADAFLPKGCNSSAELLDRVRVLATRKRGPKKSVTACVAEVRAA